MTIKQNNFLSKVGKLISEARERGICYVVCAGIKKIVYLAINYFGYCYYKILKSSRTFTFQGEVYNYFYHGYNATWRNERAVEVPIIWEIVEKNHGKRVLEVGNVLSHYFSVGHDILDKYEKANGLINKDVVDFQPSKKYDLIASISTLEHVGWDENSGNSKKILQAIENLENLLAPKGRMVITLPLGYNLNLDNLLREGKIIFTKRYCLKRISKDNKWIEVDCKDVQNARYNNPFPAANGLVIGVIENNSCWPTSAGSSSLRLSLSVTNKTDEGASEIY